MVINVNNGFHEYGCRNLEDIHQYFSRLTTAFRSIKDTGYKTQKELGNDNFDEARGYIGRNGQLILGGGGNHRIAIAELLEIKKIPFLIKGVHESWLKQIMIKHQCSVRTAFNKGLEHIINYLQ